MRSVQYDTVSSTYGKYLMEKILPEVEKTHKLLISAASSGAICAFNAAWYFPDQFSRVLSHIGSYAALQWKPEEQLDGGYIFSCKGGREPNKNLRVWLSDDAYDIDARSSSLPNMLKHCDYHFHFRFATSLHAMTQNVSLARLRPSKE